MNVHAKPSSDATAAVLLREDVGNIAVLTLNRPQARNSLSEDLLQALSGTPASHRQRPQDPRRRADRQWHRPSARATT